MIRAAIRRACLLAATAMLALLAGAAATSAASPPALRHVVLPRDHGAHPAFGVEWWYIVESTRETGGAF